MFIHLASFTALDGAGVAGHGLNIASEYVPDQYGQGIRLLTCTNFVGPLFLVYTPQICKGFHLSSFFLLWSSQLHLFRGFPCFCNP